jgi:hypothetical protein
LVFIYLPVKIDTSRKTGEKMNTPPICPRCSGFIPNNATPGAYMGALSRLDNKTEICSDCGTEEAMEDYRDGRVSDWRNI